MNGLIPLERLSPQPITQDLLALNESTWERGLVLTEEEARELSETRNRALLENDRIEFGSEVMRKIVERFSASRYLDRTNWADILNEITYYFYYIKAETEDRINDTDLAEEMFQRFELFCRGDIDRFEEKEVERIIRKVNMGGRYEKWYGDEDALDPANFGRRTPDNLLEDTYDGTLADAEDYAGGAADEIARDDEVDLDVFGDFGDEDDALSAGYENEDDLSLYDEVADETVEEDSPDHPLNGAVRDKSGGLRRDRGYFSLNRLTGRNKGEKEDSASAVQSGTVSLPGGGTLSVGAEYPVDFNGFTDDEEAFMTAFLTNEEGEPDLAALDRLIDRIAQNGGGESDE